MSNADRYCKSVLFLWKQIRVNEHKPSRYKDSLSQYSTWLYEDACRNFKDNGGLKGRPKATLDNMYRITMSLPKYETRDNSKFTEKYIIIFSRIERIYSEILKYIN